MKACPECSSIEISWRVRSHHFHCKKCGNRFKTPEYREREQEPARKAKYGELLEKADPSEWP